MICQLVPKQILGEVWPRVSGLLRDAITRGDDWWTLDLLRGTLETDNDAALFVIADHDGIYGAVVMLVEEKPNGKRQGHYPAAGGKSFAKWTRFVPEFEAWAKSRGATEVSVTGRCGWERLLRRHGYQKSSVILEKAL